MDKVQRSLPTSAQALKLQEEHLERNALFLVKDAYINEIRRSQYVDLGCLLWTLLLLAGLFVWYIIQMPHGRYRMNSAVVDLFYHDEFEGEDHLWMTFPQIQNVGEVWAWMHGPMYNALYGAQYEGLGTAFPAQLASAAPLVIHGTPLLRQIRGAEFHCGQRSSDGHLCYAEPIETDDLLFGRSDFTSESTASFGGPDGERYIWSSIAHLGLRSAAGQLVFSGQYGEGGYFVPLPRTNGTAALELLHQLQADGWIDSATRAVFLYVNVWSPLVRQIVSMQLYVEFFGAGKVIGTPRILSQPMTWQGYGQPCVGDEQRCASDEESQDGLPEIVISSGTLYASYAILVACLGTAILWILIGARRYGAAVVADPSFYVDCLALLFIFLVIYYRFFLTSDNHYTRLLEKGRWAGAGDDFQKDQDGGLSAAPPCADAEGRCPCQQERAGLPGASCDVELTVRVAAGLQAWIALLRLYSATLFLLLIKVGQYIRVFSRPNIMVTTIMRALPDLLTYMCIVALIIGVFVWTGFVVFGNVVDSYRSVTQSLRTCMFMVVGDMGSYADAVLFFPEVAPYSMLYVAVVTLVLLNMLIAILTEYFETMKEEERALSAGRAGILGNTIQEYAKLARFTLSDDLPTKAVETHDLVQLVPRPDDLELGETVALWSVQMPASRPRESGGPKAGGKLGKAGSTRQLKRAPTCAGMNEESAEAGLWVTRQATMLAVDQRRLVNLIRSPHAVTIRRGTPRAQDDVRTFAIDSGGGAAARAKRGGAWGGGGSSSRLSQVMDEPPEARHGTSGGRFSVSTPERSGGPGEGGEEEGGGVFSHDVTLYPIAFSANTVLCEALTQGKLLASSGVYVHWTIRVHAFCRALVKRWGKHVLCRPGHGRGADEAGGPASPSAAAAASSSDRHLLAPLVARKTHWLHRRGLASSHCELLSPEALSEKLYGQKVVFRRHDADVALEDLRRFTRGAHAPWFKLRPHVLLEFLKHLYESSIHDDVEIEVSFRTLLRHLQEYVRRKRLINWNQLNAARTALLEGMRDEHLDADQRSRSAFGRRACATRGGGGDGGGGPSRDSPARRQRGSLLSSRNTQQQAGAEASPASVTLEAMLTAELRQLALLLMAAYGRGVYSQQSQKLEQLLTAAAPGPACRSEGGSGSPTSPKPVDERGQSFGADI